MTFSIFPCPDGNPPVLFSSGLTCNDENFTTKAGAQRIAAELGIALVMPDTSPRGEDVGLTMPDTTWVKALGFISTPRNNRGEPLPHV